MTREHKLALIVGFSLILVVGVLISDHLSRAREARVAAVQPVESVVVSEPMPARPDPLRLVPQPVAAADPAPITPVGPAPSLAQPAPAEPVRTLASAPPPAPDTSAEPASPVQVAAAGPAPLAGEPTAPVIEIPQGRYLTAAQEDPPADDLVTALTAMGAQVVNSEIHLPAAAGMMRTPIPAILSQAPAVTSPPATIRWHTVQKGESLFQISRTYYGDGKHWPKLAAENKDAVGRDGAVRIGVKLKIPDAQALGITPAAQASAGAPRPEPGAPDAAKKASKPSAPPKRETRLVGSPAIASYTVKRGDTLGEIAQRLLGSARRKGELLALNKDRIKNENSIMVGMVLRVPEPR